jgi:hypothetical protein
MAQGFRIGFDAHDFGYLTFDFSGLTPSISRRIDGHRGQEADSYFT